MKDQIKKETRTLITKVIKEFIFSKFTPSKPFKLRIIKLIQEPSTYAGFASLLAGAGIFSISEDDLMQLFGVVIMLISIIPTIVLDTRDSEQIEEELQKDLEKQLEDFKNTEQQFKDPESYFKKE